MSILSEVSRVGYSFDNTGSNLVIISRHQAIDRISNANARQEEFHLHRCEEETTHLFICFEPIKCKWRTQLSLCPTETKEAGYMYIPSSVRLIVNKSEYALSPWGVGLEQKDRAKKIDTIYSTKTGKSEKENTHLTFGEPIKKEEQQTNTVYSTSKGKCIEEVPYQELKSPSEIQRQQNWEEYQRKTQQRRDERLKGLDKDKFEREQNRLRKERTQFIDEHSKEESPEITLFCVNDGTRLSPTTTEKLFICTNCGAKSESKEKVKKTPLIQRVKESPKYHRFMNGVKSKNSIAENHVDNTFAGMLIVFIFGLVLSAIVIVAGDIFHSSEITSVGIGIFTLTFILEFLIPFFGIFYIMYIGGFKDTIYSILTIISIILIAISLYYLGELSVFLFH